MKIRFLKKKKVITRMGHEGEEPYLVRWNLFECPLFSIKIHKILLSDDDCLHNHPWSFLSIILKTGYKEYYLKHIYEDRPDRPDYIHRTEIHSKVVRAGAILWRPANWFHRLEIDKPAWTFVITFKKVQEWGFLTSKGWVPWFKYNSKTKCE